MIKLLEQDDAEQAVNEENTMLEKKQSTKKKDNEVDLDTYAQDLKNLKKSTVPLNGVISGRAVYDKILNVGEAIKVLRS